MFWNKSIMSLLLKKNIIQEIRKGKETVIRKGKETVFWGTTLDVTNWGTNSSPSTISQFTKT